MSNFGEHFDLTIWDPNDPEQAIEDPIHGSEAIISLLETPPMPLPDGTYHVFGAFYVIGTNTFDAEGKPFKKIGMPGSGAETRRVALLLEQWLDQLESGVFPEGYPEDPAAFFDFAAKPYIVAG